MVSGIEGIMNLAAASGEDLATTSDIVTDALTAFGLQASDSGHFADILAIASSNANTNVAMMGETFKYAAPMMGAMGYSAEDAAIAIGMMANSGIKASSAGTALRAGLVNLAKPTEQMQAAMDKYGISLTDSEGNMLSFRDLMGELREKLGGLSEAEQTAAAGAIFGKNALSGWLAIINGSEADLNKLTDAVDNCTGAAQRMADVQLDNLNGDITIMGSAFDGLKTTIGEQFIPVLRELVQWATKVLGAFDEWIQENPSLFKAISTTIGVLGGLTTAIVAVNGAIKAYQALKAVGLFAGLAGPIGLAVGAVGLLAGAVVYAKEKAEEAVPSVSSMTNAVQDLDETVTDGKAAFEEQAAQYQATASMADYYIDKLDDMREANEEGVEHSTEYMATLQLLEETVPELSNLINDQTGYIEGGTEALRSQTEAWKENAKAQVEQEYMKEVMAGYGDVQKEIITNTGELIKKQKEHEDLSKQLRSAEVELQEAQNDLNNGVKGAQSRYDAASKKVRDLNNSLDQNERAQENIQQAIDEGNATLEEQKQAVEDAQAAIDAYNQTTGDATDTSNEMASAQDEIASTVREVMDAASALSEEYTKAYESAKQSLEGQFGLWDEAEKVTAGSTEEIISNISSQNDYYSQYNDNLAKLRDRATDIEGLDAALDSLNDGSEESAKVYATLSQANDDDLVKFVAAWQEREDQQELTAQNIAESQTGMLKDLDGFTSEVQNKIKGMDYGDDAKEAAKLTIQGYIDELNAQKGPVATAARAVAQAAMDELNNIHVPSVSSSGSGGSNSSHHAAGTNAAPSGVSLVGENGPELVMLNGGEKVIPAPQTAEMLRSHPVQSGPTINFAPSYQISGGNAAEIRAILEEHDRSLRGQIVGVLRDVQRNQERTVYR